MSVTSHLKDLLTKMGGTPKDGDSTSALIDKIEDVYDGSGSGGGGSASDLPLVVTIYADDAVDDNDSYSEANAVAVTLKMNKTFKEILDAYKSNRLITFRYESTVIGFTNGRNGPWPNTILVLHNNHSTRLPNDGSPMCAKPTNFGSPKFEYDCMIISENYYNLIRGIDDDLNMRIYYYNQSFSSVDIFSEMRPKNTGEEEIQHYTITLNAVVPVHNYDGHTFEQQEFICFDLNDYPCAEWLNCVVKAVPGT